MAGVIRGKVRVVTERMRAHEQNLALSRSDVDTVVLEHTLLHLLLVALDPQGPGESGSRRVRVHREVVD
jgi:hypothetical protein